MPPIGPSGIGRLREVLGSSGLLLDLGAATLVVRSASYALAEQIASVYRAFPLAPAPPFADMHIELVGARGWRRLLKPQVVLRCDGEQQFHPFPADTALPLMEWGTNWLIGQRLHDLLLFHAGCLERDGHGLLLPAVPGSGKSTLTAALAHRGWRLLSDEFGALSPDTDRLVALLKPVALKNDAIGVIRAFAPEACIGPAFPNTRKGTVAHVAAPADAVARRHEPAIPLLVVLPKWVAGVRTRMEPVSQDDLFRALAFNSFNYELLGACGFDAVMRTLRRCRGWRLEYSDLDDALLHLETHWSEALAATGPQDASPGGARP